MIKEGREGFYFIEIKGIDKTGEKQYYIFSIIP